MKSVRRWIVLLGLFAGASGCSAVACDRAAGYLNGNSPACMQCVAAMCRSQNAALMAMGMACGPQFACAAGCSGGQACGCMDTCLTSDSCHAAYNSALSCRVGNCASACQ